MAVRKVPAMLAARLLRSELGSFRSGRQRVSRVAAAVAGQKVLGEGEVVMAMKVLYVVFPRRRNKGKRKTDMEHGTQKVQIDAASGSDRYHDEHLLVVPSHVIRSPFL